MADEDSMDDWKQKYESLNTEYKRIKGISSALVDMMVKVQGRSHSSQNEEYDLHDAWKWIKGVVWEYETIKKKAL